VRRARRGGTPHVGVTLNLSEWLTGRWQRGCGPCSPSRCHCHRIQWERIAGIRPHKELQRACQITIKTATQQAAHSLRYGCRFSWGWLPPINVATLPLTSVLMVTGRPLLPVRMSVAALGACQLATVTSGAVAVSPRDAPLVTLTGPAGSTVVSTAAALSWVRCCVLNSQPAKARRVLLLRVRTSLPRQSAAPLRVYRPEPEITGTWVGKAGGVGPRRAGRFDRRAGRRAPLARGSQVC
jgi:hypothetical protein